MTKESLRGECHILLQSTAYIGGMEEFKLVLSVGIAFGDMLTDTLLQQVKRTGAGRYWGRCESKNSMFKVEVYSKVNEYPNLEL
jgi:hypothetical protein